MLIIAVSVLTGLVTYGILNILEEVIGVLPTFILAMVGLVFLITFSSQASEVSVRELSFEYKNFSRQSHNPLITDNGLVGKGMGSEVNLNVNLDVFDVFYINNKVHSYTDTHNGGRGQYRLVGWNYSVGVHPVKWLDIQYEHFSKHLLDAAFPFKSPNEDSIGVKIYLISPEGKERGVIW